MAPRAAAPQKLGGVRRGLTCAAAVRFDALALPRMRARALSTLAGRGDFAARNPAGALGAAPRVNYDGPPGIASVLMAQTVVLPKTKVRPKTQRPPLYKVILLNDDFTPREFVVAVLKAVFRMNEDQAYNVMMTAHRRGACVIAVYARDVAETKAKEGTELGKQKGYPLFFTTEPEE
jgi:ATP-dependent Clp protease adaptor protein ClpS